MAEKYILRVTAGPGYDESTHVVLPTNTESPTTIISDHCTASMTVRVQNFRGLPRELPTTSPYFDHPPHTHDQYSIGFTFVPHASVSGDALVFGNDFDRPIRDRLPPGFGTAFKIVKWAVDPGLDGDVYADKPYLYGPALSSLNTVHVGGKAARAERGTWEPGAPPAKGAALEEGAEDEEAKELRKASGAPDDAAARKKWALTEEHRAKWEWEAGRVYSADFFNPYLDFNTFSLKLPGFTLGVLPFLDGKDALRRNHDLRYVLKDRETGNVFFVVLFTLVHKDDVEKEEAEAKAKLPEDQKAAFEPKDKGQEAAFEPKDDDLD